MLDGSTFSWDGRAWVDLHPAHSISVGIPAFIAYDSAHHAAVVLTLDRVFGPTATTTWTWTGADWQQQHPVHQPSGGTAAGAYDPLRGVVVAFVGNETWTWNGADWAQQHPARSPVARYFASAAYDPAVGKVMLFGGKIYGRVNGLYRELVNNELWTWDGTNWTKAA